MAIPKKDITVSFPGGKQVQAHFNGHSVLTDQSVKNGGKGSAPEPFDLFFVSMATCVGIYVLEFCTSRELDTDGLGVHLVSELDPAEKRFPKVSIDIALPQGFPEKYRKAIWRTANLCSVKKHILNPPEFNILLDGHAVDAEPPEG